MAYSGAIPILAGKSAFKAVASRSGRLLGSLALAVLAFSAITISCPDPAAARSKYASIVVDGHTSRTVYSRSADAHRYPASLTKIMTLYIVFEELAAGRLKKWSKLKVSKRAAGMPPSKIGVKRGQTISVKDAIKALVTKSANDVAVVVAENISGTEYKFARRMTRTARRLGMKRTRFRNASGLPDRRQVTTARDMARLGIRIQRDFPQYYGYFKTRAFKYRGRTFRSHNRLLGRYPGTDGIKTGYTRASGYNLTSSVRRGGKHLVAVVMGGTSGRSRDRHMQKLLTKNFPRVAERRNKPKKPVARPPAPAAAAKTASTLKQADMAPSSGKPGAPAVITKPVSGASPNVAAANRVPPANAAKAPDAATAGKDQSKIPAIGEPAVVNASGDTAVSTVSAARGLPEAGEVYPGDASWSIQIGAYSRKQDALQRLTIAKETGVRSLHGKKAITLAFFKRDQVVYRARFAGFDRKTAQLACNDLKRKSIKCYPLAP